MWCGTINGNIQQRHTKYDPAESKLVKVLVIVSDMTHYVSSLDVTQSHNIYELGQYQVVQQCTKYKMLIHH